MAEYYGSINIQSGGSDTPIAVSQSIIFGMGAGYLSSDVAILRESTFSASAMLYSSIYGVVEVSSSFFSINNQRYQNSMTGRKSKCSREGNAT